MKSWQDGKDNLVKWVRTHPTATGWGALVVIGLVFIVGVVQPPFAKPDRVSLFDSRPLTSDEIGKMQIAFSQSELNEYEIQETQIIVPRDQRSHYLNALAEHGAVPLDIQPPDESPGSLNFFPSREQLRIQQIAKKKRTIRDMVLRLRFVERAIVDYDETRGVTAFDNMQRTAIVTVSPTDNRPLGFSEVKAIRDTVCGAVAGLLTQEITIIDAPGGKSYTGEIASDPDQEQPHTLQQNKSEQKYETKIRSALMAYPGIRVNVEVGVDSVVRRTRDQSSVEGDPQLFRRTRKSELIPGVPSTKPSPSFPNFFGLGTNGRGRVEPLAKNENQQIVETTELIANGTFETTVYSGPTITHVNVSIGIPERCLEYFVSQQAVSDEMNQETLRAQIFDQLKEDIQQKVKPLLPGTEMATDSQIVVTLDREIPLPEATIAGTALTQAWPPLWPWPVCIGGGVLLLVLLRIYVRSIQKTSHTPSLASDLDSARNPSETSPPPSQSIEARDSQPLTPSFENAGPHFTIPTPHDLSSQADSVSGLDVEKQLMRDQLDQWCRDNPNAAADTIQQWLSRKAG